MYSGRLRDLPGLDRLFQAILALQEPEECYRFFDDLCTVGELKAMAQRFAVAQLLIQGAKYEEVEKATGASSATISRVKRFVEYGSGGYGLVHERIRETGPDDQSKGAGPE